MGGCWEGERGEGWQAQRHPAGGHGVHISGLVAAGESGLCWFLGWLALAECHGLSRVLLQYVFLCWLVLAECVLAWYSWWVLAAGQLAPAFDCLTFVATTTLHLSQSSSFSIPPYCLLALWLLCRHLPSLALTLSLIS